MMTFKIITGMLKYLEIIFGQNAACREKHGLNVFNLMTCNRDPLTPDL